MCVHGVRLLDADVRKMFPKSRFIGRRLSSSLFDYDGALVILRARRTKRCILRQKKIYAGQGTGGHKRLLSSSVLIRRKSDRRK